MNYCKCVNCWWWMNGICYFDDIKTEGNSYCPDYTNRTKTNKEYGTLEEWIKQKRI